MLLAVRGSLLATVLIDTAFGFLKSNLIEFFKNLNIKKAPEYMISDKMV